MKRPTGKLALTALGAVVAVLGAAAFAWFGVAPTEGGADPNDKAQVAVGERVYGKSCASCHGADLEGQPDWRIRKADGRLPAPPHDATGHTWHHPDDVLFGITKKGPAAMATPGYQSDMPGFGDTLTDEEIWAALAYIKSRWPEEIRARQAARNQTRGRQ